MCVPDEVFSGPDRLFGGTFATGGAIGQTQALIITYVPLALEKVQTGRLAARSYRRGSPRRFPFRATAVTLVENWAPSAPRHNRAMDGHSSCGVE